MTFRASFFPSQEAKKNLYLLAVILVTGKSDRISPLTGGQKINVI
jgi:hypothetical protein